MFLGEHSATMDDRGRVAVPAKYRDRLKKYFERRAKSQEGAGEFEDLSGLESDSLIVTVSLMERCLVVYAPFEWTRITSMLRDLPTFDSQAHTIRHAVLGYAEDCGLDRQGRILVPERLRRYAGLSQHAKTDLKLIGQDSKFEIWRHDLWEEKDEMFNRRIEHLKEDPNSVLSTLVL